MTKDDISFACDLNFHKYQHLRPNIDPKYMKCIQSTLETLNLRNEHMKDWVNFLEMVDKAYLINGQLIYETSEIYQIV